jgi:hypothetical protein
MRPFESFAAFGVAIPMVQPVASVNVAVPRALVWNYEATRNQVPPRSPGASGLACMPPACSLSGCTRVALGRRPWMWVAPRHTGDEMLLPSKESRGARTSQHELRLVQDAVSRRLVSQ